MSMKQWLGRQLKSAIRSKQGVRTRRWLGIGPATVANQEIDHIQVPGEVVIYFSDVVSKAYQLQQWLPTLEQLHERHGVVLVFRKVPTLRHFRKLTALPKIFVRRLDDLVSLYDFNDFRICLYVNNGMANFQSLSAARLVHVHINHGESDKLSMVSNQAKAYDKIFVAGPAAVERHKSVLVDFDLGHLLSVGRPQLDQEFETPLAPYPGQTIMYAPTWEGENEANNYTSMDLFGENIVQALLDLPETRVIYKPHPRIVTSMNPAISAAHLRIRELIDERNTAGAQHVLAEEENILALFEGVDALVTDISSVCPDYLYLYPDRPLVLTDRRNDLKALSREAPISTACPVINESSQESILAGFSTLLDTTSAEERIEMRAFYFGDRPKGASTISFLESIDSLIRNREDQLRAYEFHSNAAESTEDE